MSVEQPASPAIEEPAPPAAVMTAPRQTASPAGASASIAAPLKMALRAAPAMVAGALLTAGLLGALVLGGLVIGPTIGVAAYDTAAPPRRPPIVPPSVPQGAREDWAVWSYVEKINQAWGKDWPQVIAWFEELDARYPGNPMVYDKLYAAYIEDGRTLWTRGDPDGARRRFEQAAAYDPGRGIAQDYLAELDKARRGLR